jgi:hypothetical protein
MPIWFFVIKYMVWNIISRKFHPTVKGMLLKGRYVLLHQLQSLMFSWSVNNREEKCDGFMCDKMCSEQFSRPEVNIIRVFIVFCVYWCINFDKFVRISILFEPLNIKVMIESGVVCRSLCSAASRKWPKFRIKPKNIGFRNIYIGVYCLPHVLIYFPIRYMALKILKNSSEKYR